MIRIVDDEIDAPLAEGWFPIREVTRLTGVNPVTLRAWERRYGLIVPRRTPKGHRLYDESHVKRILDILGWLNRGVAISQAKQLLDARQTIDLSEHNQWGSLHEQMRRAVADLSDRQLDDHFNRALSLYPPLTLSKHLLLPLLLELEQRWANRSGAELERGLFNSWLRTKLGTRIYHNNRQHNGAPYLMMPLGEQHFESGLWLSAWLVSSTGCPVEVIERSVPLTDVPLALEKINPRGLVLYASQSLASGYLKRQLPRLATPHDPALMLAGPAASIHEAELRNVPGLTLAVDPIAVLETLRMGSLLDDPKGYLE